MSATTPTDTPIAQVQARRTEHGPQVCVTDHNSGLEMCWPLLETLELAARMVDCAGAIMGHAMHEAERAKVETPEPPPVRLFVPSKNREFGVTSGR